MDKKLFIISAINIFEGGTLSVLKDSLKILNENYINNYNIIVLVHKKELFSKYKFRNLKFIEFRNSKKSYLHRIYYEYYFFNLISKKLKPDFWLSFLDTTPILSNTKQFVYCHNPSPFNNYNIKDYILQPKQLLFKLLYKYVYKFNINKNTFVIVQQLWLKNSFTKLFNINEKKIIISKPSTNLDIKYILRNENFKNTNTIFFFPTYPRPFKNVEIVCDAAIILSKNGIHNFKIYLTLNGTENSYSKYIFNKYSSYENIIFLGILSREDVYNMYSKTDCLIFPSKLETWGMPLSEFVFYNKPILVSNMQYAIETLGDYKKVKFFNPNNCLELSKYMQNIISNDLKFDETQTIDYPNPFTDTWFKLFDLLLK